MIRFTVKPLYVQEGSTTLGRWVLRRFQEHVRDAIERDRDTLLVAPTGSGKTLSLLLGDMGAVGVYPNNTLLLDQQKSIHKILTEALGARLTYPHSKDGDGVDILRVYEIPSTGKSTNKPELPITGFRRVAIVLLSGRYLGYEYDEEGNLIPKRMVIIKDIVERICYPSKGEYMPYIVTLATPDTALMIMAGIYRDLEKVGYTLHDFLLAAAEGYESIDWLLSKHKVALVGELGDLAGIRQCLLKYPWFIDEFHLYGTYEAYSLLPVMRVYRDYVGWDEPFVLSSATPKGALYEIAESRYKLHRVDEKGMDSGDPSGLVRGETSVEVEVVSVPGKDGYMKKWFLLGYKVPDILSERINEIENTVKRGGNVFIVVDRVNQVPSIVDVLVDHGIKPECSVTIKPAKCSNKKELVLVGSKSITQGIDRANVRYGIITAYDWASLLQRFGRIGRKTDSKIVILVTKLKSRIPLASLNGREVSYTEFAETVVAEFPDEDFRRQLDIGNYLDLMKKRSALIEYASIVGFAQVSKPKGVIDALSRKAGSHATALLGMFYGPPETIAKLLTFRSNGFPVIVEKPDGDKDVADIATVLRNYKVEKVDKDNEDNKGKPRIRIRISFKPERQKLVLIQNSSKQKLVNPGIVTRLVGKVTTIGELSSLGYSLRIDSWSGKGLHGIEVPLTVDVREQALLLLKAHSELVRAYTYSARGVEVIAGEGSLIGLFI